MDINNLLDKKYKILKMHIKFRRRIDEHSENFNKELGNKSTK